MDENVLIQNDISILICKVLVDAIWQLFSKACND